MKRIAVFASGSGTNFDAIQRAILNQELDAKIVLLVCDKPNALVIEKAKQHAIEHFVFNPKDYASKSVYEAQIVEALNSKNVELVVLAGYMRLLSEVLLNAYQDRILNIHPSLLPAFKGKDAIGQAIDYGVKIMGVTIHYVNLEMDGGKIIAQSAFEVTDTMSKDEIEAQVHNIEHQLYPKTINKILKELKWKER